MVDEPKHGERSDVLPEPYSYRVYIDDLYVMQNEHGLIKIGRSVDPEQRRRQLQRLDQCKIELVKVLSSRGRREPAVHRALRKHHIEGEWFEGHDASRAAITRVLRAGVLEWPFPLAESDSEAWLDRLFDVRSLRLARKEYDRQLRELRHCGPGWVADSRIWSMLSYSQTGKWPMFDVGGEGDAVVLTAYGDGDISIVVPPYSAEIELALTLWPEDAAVVSWDGDAHACCAAALKVVGNRLFSRPKKP